MLIKSYEYGSLIRGVSECCESSQFSLKSYSVLTRNSMFLNFGFYFFNLRDARKCLSQSVSVPLCLCSAVRIDWLASKTRSANVSPWKIKGKKCCCGEICEHNLNVMIKYKNIRSPQNTKPNPFHLKQFRFG